ncbi:patatin-like phospholipase family protein [Aliiroseovarius crassostreae]|uniref:patatin-like phospholipase family protein n=1 Tax=Aliiroseovarius crassostreae TaxID=154981 RepID=UPI003C7A0CEB
MVKHINLALQGGGAHGAFTWGVLDRLLDDERLKIAAITGTSAGALNGAALKAGLMADGSGYDRAGAKASLDALWHRVGGIHDLRLTNWLSSIFAPNDTLTQVMELSPTSIMADFATRLVSPYHIGPFYQNPLRSVVDALAFDAVCAQHGPKLFIAATNVRSGKVRVFSGEELSTDVILASACLPTIFQAVEIDDPQTGRREAFWDGGYTANPALFPLFDKGLPDDLVIVNINPLHREDLPKTPTEIHNRVNEISFNSSLLRELRAISFVKRLIAEGAVKRGTMKDVLVHMIADDDLMGDLSAVTKLTPTPVMLTRMKEAGRRAADHFLDAHFDDIGARGSVDLAEMFG